MVEQVKKILKVKLSDMFIANYLDSGTSDLMAQTFEGKGLSPTRDLVQLRQCKNALAKAFVTVCKLTLPVKGFG